MSFIERMTNKTIQLVGFAFHKVLVVSSWVAYYLLTRIILVSRVCHAEDH